MTKHDKRKKAFPVEKERRKRHEKRKREIPVIRDRRSQTCALTPEMVSKNRLLGMLCSAMGDELEKILIDPDVIDVILNPDGALWVEKLGAGRSKSNITVKPESAEQIIRLLASDIGEEITPSNPFLSTEIPNCGCRFEGVLPPIVNSPTFAIRKRALLVFTLEDYATENIISSHLKEQITEAILDRKNIVVVGGTGSGKTTLSNAIIDVISKTDSRLIILEDTRELQSTAENVTFMRSAEGVADLTRLLKSCMRQSPDRIIVGEVRGGEALALIKAWNTGHPGGLCTIHANDCLGGLYRIEQLIEEVAPKASRLLISQAVNMLVYIERFENSRLVTEAVIVKGLDKRGNYVVKSIL